VVTSPRRNVTTTPWVCPATGRVTFRLAVTRAVPGVARSRASISGSVRVDRISPGRSGFARTRTWSWWSVAAAYRVTAPASPAANVTVTTPSITAERVSAVRPGRANGNP